MNAVGAMNVERRDSWAQKERMPSGLESLRVSRHGCFKESQFPAYVCKEMLLPLSKRFSTCSPPPHPRPFPLSKLVLSPYIGHTL